MHGLDGAFQDLGEVACDGFGPSLEGRRGRRVFTIRVLTGVRPRSVPEDLVARLAHPAHAALLPVEVGVATDGAFLAAPLEGKPLSALASADDGGPMLSPG